ncbi:UDP-glycosyltransferase UGT5-like [Macrosteles quadrilineatus]|uniref:UDP-glycosyltransferase UGT5-like n=1 Tax=Macrosteles quadrilineatus TaxID=74068 RepID=UPI0023E282E3|nr:UDP-glycosyltransferase UGT5-like [Macrosteles quadrilineatus]XP_054277648.1 UDP-glycosyltransferase UGT5-like [Macrosteles quadrilineatus]
MKWLLVVLGTAQCLQIALTAKILALCAVASHSHSLWCYRFMAVLAERGHQITVFGVDHPKITIPNLKTFIAEDVYKAFEASQDLSDSWASLSPDSKIGSMYLFQSWLEISTKPIMRSKALKDLINEYRDFEKPFDLIIHDDGSAEALLGLVPLFGNPPLLLATTYGTPQWMTSRLGNFFNPAYVPNMISDFDQHMTFWERCENTFYYLFVEWFVRTKFDPFQEKMKQEVFGKNLPHVRDIAKRANVVIVNHHPALNEPRPFLPGVIGIAGLHISDPQPLPKDIQEFMDGAENGVILICFGTNIDSTWFSQDFETQILQAFEGLPQRVLWKWDKELKNVPSNVKISKWLPQGDMLVHPKMRLFITHCGLLSTQEAIFRQVPILALPVFLDQRGNAEKLVRRNLTKILDVGQLTAEGLRNGINEILSNPMYKHNIEKLGKLFVDSPQTAAQQAVYWTEYLISHHGAPHLYSPAKDLPWYQLLLLDVIALVAAIVIITVWLVKKLVMLVIGPLLGGKIKNKTD